MQQTKHFLYTFLLSLFLVIGSVINTFTRKGQFEIFVNKLHHPILDIFFTFWTFIGDGWFMLPVIVGLLFVRFYYAFFCFVSIMVSTVIVQFLKLNIFASTPRPKSFFQGIDLYYVEGVEVFLSNSFPSGHSAQAFCTSTVLAIMVTEMGIKNEKLIHVLLLLIALLVAMSRIYLLQHFLHDTLAGAAFGAIVAYTVYFLFIRWKVSIAWNGVLQQSILNINR